MKDVQKTTTTRDGRRGGGGDVCVCVCVGGGVKEVGG